MVLTCALNSSHFQVFSVSTLFSVLAASHIEPKHILVLLIKTSTSRLSCISLSELDVTVIDMLAASNSLPYLFESTCKWETYTRLKLHTDTGTSMVDFLALKVTWQNTNWLTTIWYAFREKSWIRTPRTVCWTHHYTDCLNIDEDFTIFSMPTIADIIFIG